MKTKYIFTDLSDLNNPWFLTNNGLYPISQCTIVGTLLVTPTRVERDYVVFNNFQEIDESRGDLLECKDDYVGTWTKVGYVHYTYQMKFGYLTKSIGEWMDNGCYYDINNNRTVIRVN